MASERAGEETEPKVRMVCSHCGSDDVIATANVRWDYDAQKWVVADVHDQDDFCGKCDGETQIIGVENG